MLLHSIYGWIDNVDVNSISNIRYILDINILSIFVRTGVPIFLMISGVLLLDPDKKLNFDKILKYIIRMLLVLVIFGFGYCLIDQFFVYKFSNIPSLFINSIVNLLSGKSWAHMWYIYYLIGIYVITPIIRTFISSYEKKF